MPFSTHSHSGEFCEGHAKNSLREIIDRAVELQMSTLALTEHMPRDAVDFYPEEIEMGQREESLYKIFDDYVSKARKLQAEYRANGKIELLVGMEIDWIRPEASFASITSLLEKYELDMFVGSVHHVHTIPIDYDRAMYERARQIAGGTDERLFEDYYDAQYEMLRRLKPPVVGHFDLIRLKSDDPDVDLEEDNDASSLSLSSSSSPSPPAATSIDRRQRWPGVWRQVCRNIEFIASYGGVLEINSAALRKGMREPYPGAAVCKEALARKVGFTLSDDSHGVEQVGFGFREALAFAEVQGIQEIVRFVRVSAAETEPRVEGAYAAKVEQIKVPLRTMQTHPFFFDVGR
ncbi:histidinolphosphatase [Agyrium rufum]|nr:histidinolphosphatase [Agyrium rufum]